MKIIIRIILIMIVVCSIILLLYCGSYRVYSEKELTGKYVNNYQESMSDNPSCTFERPNRKDTLVLFDDKTFKSNYFGHGTYRITKGYWSWNRNISLSYKEGNMMVGFNMSINNKSLFGCVPQFTISTICTRGDYYYKKISW
ncbi:hypothetical protein [Viscerimonas tarda]